jgi:hypothetical protein
VLQRDALTNWVSIAFQSPARKKEPTSRDQPDQAASEVGLIVRSDGQRLRGRLIGGSGDGQTARWRHPTLGGVAIALDQLRGFHRNANHLPKAGDDDVILLKNGDRLTGFLEAIHETTLTVDPNKADQSLTLPLKRVRALRLANPLQNWPDEQHTLTLEDGSRLAASDLELHEQALRAQAPWLKQGTASFAVKQIRRLSLTGGPWRLIPLARQDFELISGGSAFGVAMPPRVMDRSVALHAPVAVRFTLPNGAKRFSTHVRLAPEAGAEAVARWAGCTLLIEPADGETARFSFDGQKARQKRINLAMKPGASAITLRVEPGINGPVLDRLQLDDARILVKAGEKSED